MRLFLFNDVFNLMMCLYLIIMMRFYLILMMRLIF